MSKILFKSGAAVAGVAIAGTLGLSLLKAIPVMSATQSEEVVIDAMNNSAVKPISPSTTPVLKVATAAQPPYLVPAKLGGKPIHVLYLTRAGDTVLVRCYPTFQPVLVLNDRAGQPGEKEGKLTCKPGNS